MTDKYNNKHTITTIIKIIIDPMGIFRGKRNFYCLRKRSSLFLLFLVSCIFALMTH